MNLYFPDITDFANQTDFATVTNITGPNIISNNCFRLYHIDVFVSSGQDDCSPKYCEVSRMYLTWETFGTTWFPILFALGVYCLVDGFLQTLIFFLLITLNIYWYPSPYN